MRRIAAAAALAVLTMTMLTACGDDDNGTPSGSSQYCDDLEAAKDSFSGLLNNQIGQDTFVELQNSLPALQAAAPAPLQDDWKTFSTAVLAFSAAMKKAGLTMDDMRDMGSGTMPGGMDMQTAMDAAAALGSAKVSTAQSAIVANALKNCNIDLNS